MKTKLVAISLLFLISFLKLSGQEGLNQKIFTNQPINFGGEKGENHDVIRLQGGRVIIKKVTVPKFVKDSDVKIKLTLRSNGDRWDKSGSCFVVTNPNQISIINVSKGESKFPKGSFVEGKYQGILATDNYKPVVELLRFMTPFGVGYYSHDKGKHRKPVYIPKWENEVVWEKNISELENLVSGTFYIGVWIDSWTKEGYKIDLSLFYSNRPKKVVKVIPLVNTIPYVDGQSLPDFFSRIPLKKNIKLKQNIKKVKLYYTVTGHGGHEGGDEFTKIKNSIWLDNKLILDTIPWRDDCASFRRFNPTSGVWLKKDSASYIDFKAKAYMIKEIEERIASSDLSRSNWCPGSYVEPFIIELGDLKAGKHILKIKIPATKASKDKYNHWLVSAYLTYEN